VALPPDTAASLDRLAQFGIRLGLERMKTLLAALGDPQASLPIVLVAGTNGKGTVSALLSSFGRAARYTTGLYTSPHLETVEERMRIDGHAIDAERLAPLLDRVIEAADDHLDEPPTYFEALTLAALLWFADEEVDLAILEVGLGGRFDATNAVEPRLSVVTSIALDHREHLGSTLEAIAGEKAGILRPGVPAVVADLAPGPAAVFTAEAARLGTPLIPLAERFLVDAIQRFRPFVDPQERRQRVWLRPPSAVDTPGVETESEVYEIALSGRHQADNLALAVAAASELRELGWERLTVRAIKKGAKACRWPGRLEEVELPEGEQVLLDVAHNPEGTAALAEFLGTLGEQGESVDMVFGVLKDKVPAEMVPHLLPRVRKLWLTRPSGDRGMKVDVLRPAVEEAIAELGPGKQVEVAVEEKPARALRKAIDGAESGEDSVPVVVCGSLVLVGELRTELHRRYGTPEPAVTIDVGP